MNQYLPFSSDGRRTLVYLTFAGAGPSLTLMVWWLLNTIRTWTGVDPKDALASFSNLSFWVVGCLLTVCVTMACYIAVKEFKIGPGGIDAQSQGGDICQS